MSEPSEPNLSSGLLRAIIKGGMTFSLVSVFVFATVAFGERAMYARLGVAGAYIAWTAIFILLGGAAFGSLVASTHWRLPKFYLLWAAAFFAYAAGWVGAYFTLRGSAGEWAGSLIGSLLMTLVFALGFRSPRSVPKLTLLLFVANSAGYFPGSALNNSLGGRAGMLLWGVVYGVFLGAGIAGALYLLTLRRKEIYDAPYFEKN